MEHTKKILLSLVYLLILLFFIPKYSAAELNDIINNLSLKNKYPTVEEAFNLNAAIKNKNNIELTITTIPNTYLYAKAFKFSVDNNAITLNEPIFPKSEIIDDPHFGKTKVFHDKFTILIGYKSQATNLNSFNFKVDYQGCLKDTLCYPPKNINFKLSNKDSSTAASQNTQQLNNDHITAKLEALPQKSTANNDHEQAIQLLKNAKIWSIIGGFFLFGLLLSLTPCVLPMLPILSGIITGHKNKLNKKQAFTLSLIYVLSMAITYMIAGLLIAAAGLNIVGGLQKTPVVIIVCLIFIFLALSSFGYIELTLPQFIQNKLNNTQKSLRGGSYFSVAIMGIISSLIISPCATAPLAGALLYISSSGSIWLGGLALFIMGLAMGIPLLIFGTSAGHWLPKAGPWMKEINVFFGVVFIGLAIYLSSRLMPGPIILIIWALLLIFYAIHLGLLEPATHNGLPKIKKGFALLIAIYGGFLLAGATMNQSDVLHPFGLGQQDSYQGNYSNNSNNNQLEFKKIKTIDDLKATLSSAQRNEKFTILDFYADWCGSCRNMEQKVFTHPKVKSLLTNFNRLKVDITEYNHQDKKIMTHLSVFNPPTLIFYDKNGKELLNQRIIGEINAENLLTALQNIRNEL